MNQLDYEQERYSRIASDQQYVERDPIERTTNVYVPDDEALEDDGGRPA